MNCPAFLDGFCLVKGCECKEESPCPIANDITKEELYEYLAKKYHELKQQRREIDKKLKVLKTSLIKLGPGVYGSYEVIVKEYSRTLLNNDAVKTYLEEAGILQDFVKEVKTVSVDVRPHVPKT